MNHRFKKSKNKAKSENLVKWGNKKNCLKNKGLHSIQHALKIL